jgi:hypothetical protein
MRFSKPKRVSVTPYAKVQRTSRLVCRRCSGTKNGRLTIEGLKVRSMGEKSRGEAAVLTKNAHEQKVAQ